jgi:unconventional SNARE in the endoplasmic reticulum protein 1
VNAVECFEFFYLMSAKLELNIRSLIGTCEELVKDEEQRWRLNRYLKSLDTMMKELED